VYYDVIAAGFGGQGVQTITQIVAAASIKKGLNLTYLPSYGVEKRGGRTNVTMVISDEEIGSPVINKPQCVIAMDVIAIEKYMPEIVPGGVLIINSSLIPEGLASRDDIRVIRLRCNEEALQLGSAKYANMIALGAFIQATRFLSKEEVEAIVPEVTAERLKHTIPANISAIRRGIELAENGNACRD
jgi:2-oxoglutarate ferredoxin oxidoreductase subunit gamma